MEVVEVDRCIGLAAEKGDLQMGIQAIQQKQPSMVGLNHSCPPPPALYHFLRRNNAVAKVILRSMVGSDFFSLAENFAFGSHTANAVDP